jgi:hypothetical protein
LDQSDAASEVPHLVGNMYAITRELAIAGNISDDKEHVRIQLVPSFPHKHKVKARNADGIHE